MTDFFTSLNRQNAEAFCKAYVTELDNGDEKLTEQGQSVVSWLLPHRTVGCTTTLLFPDGSEVEFCDNLITPYKPNTLAIDKTNHPYIPPLFPPPAL